MIRGITQRQISEDTGIAQPNVCKYLSGKKIPNVDTAGKLAKALGISTEDFYRIVIRARLDSQVEEKE
jgi:transcriptional regulator with XRE-family HTH domain